MSRSQRQAEREARRLARQNGPYWNIRHLDQANQELPEGRHLTRSSVRTPQSPQDSNSDSFHTVDNDDTERELDTEADTDSETNETINTSVEREIDTDNDRTDTNETFTQGSDQTKDSSLNKDGESSSKQKDKEIESNKSTDKNTIMAEHEDNDDCPRVTLFGEDFVIHGAKDWDPLDQVVNTQYKEIEETNTRTKGYGQIPFDDLQLEILKMKNFCEQMARVSQFAKAQKVDGLSYMLQSAEVSRWLVLALERKGLVREQSFGLGSGSSTPNSNASELEILRTQIQNLSQNLLSLQMQPTFRQVSAPASKKRRPPPLTVKPFKGDKKDFLRFKTAFKDTYEDTDLSKTSLAIHLGEHLDGEPRQRFAYMISSADDSTYDILWKCLENFYGTSSELALEKLEKFHNLPAVRSFNPSTITLLYTTLEEHWHLLQKSLGSQFSTENNMTFYSFLKKMPLHEVAKFSESCRVMQRKRNFESFKEWLSNQWDVWKHAKDKGSVDKALVYWHQDIEENSSTAFLQNLVDDPQKPVTVQGSSDLQFDEYGNALVSYAPDSNEQYLVVRDGKVLPVNEFVFKADGNSFKKKPDSYKTKGSGTSKMNPNPVLKKTTSGLQPDQCPQCKEKGHYAYKCPQFQALSQKARYLTVKEHKLCLKCLRSGHFARECKLTYSCDIRGCGKPHNRMLHQDRPSPIYYILHALQGIEIEDEESEE